MKTERTFCSCGNTEYLEATECPLNGEDDHSQGFIVLEDEEGGKWERSMPFPCLNVLLFVRCCREPVNLVSEMLLF